MEPIPLLLMETNDSRKRDRFARRKGEEGVAYDRTDQPVSLPAVNGKRQRERERRGREKIKKKKEKKEGRKKRMSQGCLVRFHREGLILDRLNIMGIQSPFFHDNYTRSH